MKHLSLISLFVLFNIGIAYTQPDPVTWSISEGYLVISGSGDMIDYDFVIETPPWYSLKDGIIGVIIEEGITGIGEWAFKECGEITSVSIANTVKTIGAHAFNFCQKLSSVDIPNSVISIGNGAFSFCDELSSVKIPASVVSIGSTAFTATKLDTITIPSGVVSIGDMAFYDCAYLASVTIPASVSSIGNMAFGLCNRLTEFVNYRLNPQELDNAFAYVDLSLNTPWGWRKLHVPTASVDLYNVADEWEDFGIIKAIDDFLPGGNIGDLNWEIHDETLTISGNGVMPHYIDLQTPPWLEHQHLITNVVINEGVTGIGTSAFRNLLNLTSVFIPQSLATIGAFAFSSCPKLQTINIPEQVTYINPYTFVNNSLTSVTVAENNLNYSSLDGVLFNKNKTILILYPSRKTGEAYTIPETVETIEESAFIFSVLTSVSIPASVNAIGNSAFCECSNLSQIINFNTIPQDLPLHVFLGVDFNNCILRVPILSIGLYRNSDIWSNFKNIVPLETDIALSHNSICLLTGKTALLRILLPDEAIGGNVVNWSSDNPHVVTVASDGTVTANNIGSAAITATIDSEQAICFVTVLEPGKTTIEGRVNTPNTENIRLNLFIKLKTFKIIKN